ncbi:hypothetical protein COU20_00020 [Candidatus Kaiserbacteria bacterium CG10_big_fil_rev_8_21_14_0_10_59_10]|uniref:Uncharacterized protein n=1 Tax=Candidatus Kaiserbacteria bacterium CG10_big_fil_rev_8_21_14_0_10_59_10 TaxID=1974612 RepID=A0A2H0U8Y9_9BACT|nr:MAG: hypothetical protein COU20_00020 [Candidatus Kaiserbacteria bacterium CG10_big_fil_rev_8_21_14_0_10_59_10]
MGRAYAHARTALLLGAGVLLIAGGFVVGERAPERGGEGALRAWGSSSAFIDPSAYAPLPQYAETPSVLNTQTTPRFLPLAPRAALGDGAPLSDELGAILRALTRARPTAPAALEATTTSLSYEFIPQGLIALPGSDRARSPREQALYEYGNEVGSYIQEYETRHPNVARVLRDQLEDRQSASKGAAVREVGIDLGAIGEKMGRMEQVPSDVRSLHAALAEGYRDIGERLRGVPDAQGDAALLQAIEAYNAAADSFAGDFVALAEYLALSGVIFSHTDPGSAFTFSAGGAF